MLDAVCNIRSNGLIAKMFKKTISKIIFIFNFTLGAYIMNEQNLIDYINENDVTHWINSIGGSRNFF